jgi:prepilin-type processing-associated H-X9-DG protein
MFQHFREGPSFTYSRAVANGHYALWLEFAEPHVNEQRTFDIYAEGERRIAGLDLTAEAGAQTAYAKCIDVTITDGRLDLSFVGVEGNAIVAAIQLLPTDVPAEVAPNVSPHGYYAPDIAFADARNEALKVRSGSDLRQIGQALLFYANEHKGSYPPDLKPLVTDEGLSYLALAGPRTNTSVPRGELSEVEQVAWVAHLNDFLYRGAGKKISQFSASTPLAYENPDRVPAGGDIVVLMGDGSVRYVERSAAAAMIGYADRPPTDAPPPNPAPATGDARVVNSADNLRNIGQAGLNYGNEHSGHYPLTPGLLYTDEALPPERFVNPRGTTALPAGMTREQTAAWVDASTDYLWFGARKRVYGAPDDVLAIENPAEMAAGVNILFLDGHVEYRETRWALETLARVGGSARLPLAGDATRDGAVDFNDLVKLAQNYNRSGRAFVDGDFNYDGVVDFGDLAILAQRYNAAAAESASELLAAVTPATKKPAKAAVFSVTPVTKAVPKAPVRRAAQSRCGVR